MKYYELSDGNQNGSNLPDIHFCHEYKATGQPLSGVALLPPQCLDIESVEVARLLRLTTTSIEPGEAVQTRLRCHHLAMPFSTNNIESALLICLPVS